MRLVIVAFGVLTAGAVAYRLQGSETIVSSEPLSIEADVALFERRAQEDPWSAADRAQLAGLYVQRGRETGEYADFRRAEQAARDALRLRSSRNRKAQLTLASSLLAQHRFLEARAAAERLVTEEPTDIGGRALLAEIILELGDYGAAAPEFTLLSAYDENLAVAPRLARWHELNGREGVARALLLRAAAAARARPDLPPEQIAWFELRIADLALRHGELDDAENAIDRVLIAQPRDARLLAARARLHAARGKWKRALNDVRAAGSRADIATLGLGGDAASRLGDAALAEDYYARAEASYRDNPEPFARQWTQFCLDHNRYLPETLRTLEEEIRVRPDVLGYQLLARAYHLAGRGEEAQIAIRRANRLGTNDPALRLVTRQIISAQE